jgi:hypothetical protein
MSHATRRGIRDHELVEHIERARMRLDRMPALRRRQAERLMVVAVMMVDPRCTALEALEAADRLFPLDSGNMAE